MTGGWIFVTVGPGLSGNFEAVFTWETAWTPDAFGGQDLYWQKQPGTVRDPVLVAWSPGGPTYTASGELSGDRVVKLRADGVSLTNP